MASPFLPSSQPPKGVPSHVAIVMDGNGRWAQKRWLPRVAGHKRGVDALQKTVQCCLDRRVSALTVFAFSSENWNRPTEEVTGLMELLVMALSREVPNLKKHGVRLYFPGNRSQLSARVVQGLEAAEADTAGNNRLALNVCFNYGGRWDVVQAARRLAQTGREITEQSLSEATALSHVGDPDLLIRTGGELRISNFLLWQSAYTELYFTDCLWPDFDAAELDKALTDFSGRQRRFGQTAEQSAAGEPLDAAEQRHA
ncbi:MAG: polyprenyl diphosphate synthase [Hydrogenophaga sp.]|uniref:polyprenyl diphosphate synthase n=1 Tax=Hydrogenophaga sp. TaxID=1904254 RepID=UPI0027215099|nr:polyprenyl diphosphate synthase [Hydrogenophaga sp.]MDO9481275.1 polyprenyl diphosphate synthase [Hydrogenophaga sp.]MDP1894642.1 polyprenyl diphosphate synthase [Hydrogenophaga sp.]MDP2220884.1 polyprenyl diphosphate synthase [Hydrogenophaga sp.]MDP3343540.1 polyprenyl diphosphate synthase [Hydrogenophaga sp.]MDP3808146.1 polyprenyl diphosphate synthase [Hydrogenophaga sp.]